VALSVWVRTVLVWQVRAYDEISRLDAQKTSLLLEVKKKLKEKVEDIC
jgi:hypothetical protein